MLQSVLSSLQIIVSETLQIYNRSTFTGKLMIPFLLICLVLFLLNRKADERVRKWMIYPAWIMLLVVLNPVLMHYVYKFQMFERTVRLYWAMPFGLLLVYAFTETMSMCRGKWQRTALVLTAAVLLYTAVGSDRGDSEYVNRADNACHVPPLVIELSELMHETCSKEQPTVALPLSLDRYMRIYDPSIRLTYGYWDSQDEFQNEMDSEDPDLYIIGGEYAKQYGCDFIVLKSGKAYYGSLELYGYTAIGTVSDEKFGCYTVYYNPDMETVLP